MIFNFSPTQKWLTQVVEETFENQFGSEINIGKVEVGLFNRVTFRDVVIYDLGQQPLLKAGLLSAKIEWSSLLRDEVTLRTVSILDGNVNLYTEKQGESPNFQFIIDAIRTKDKAAKKKLNLCVNSLILRRLNLNFNQYFQPETPGKLNFSHVGLDSLDANISLKRLTSDSLNFRIRSLAFKEKSGLDVCALSLRFSANRNHCDISHFKLDLPGTHLAKEGLKADYEFNDVNDFWSTLKLSGSLGKAQISTDDLAFLYPKLRSFSQNFVLSADFEITPRLISLQHLRVDELNNYVHLNAKGWLGRKDGAIVNASGVVRNFQMSQSFLVQLTELLSDKEAPVLVKNVGDLVLRGKVNYIKDAWSTFRGDISAQSGSVVTELKWKGKQVAGHVDLKLKSLQQVLQNEKMPEEIALRLKGTVDLNREHHAQGKVMVNVDKAVYRDYLYRGIEMQAALKQNKLDVQLFSPEEKAQMALNFSALLKGKKLTNMKLDGEIFNFAPQFLGLTDYFGANSIGAHLQVGLKDFDFMHPHGYVAVNNFKLEGDTSYCLKGLNISARPSNRGTVFRMKSDFGSARLDGSLSMTDIKCMVDNIIGHKFPQLVSMHAMKKYPSWVFHVNLKNSDFFKYVLHSPVSFDKGLAAEGNLSADGKNIFVSAVVDHLKVNTTELSGLRLLMREREDELLARLQLNKRMGKKNVHFELENRTSSGRLLTDLIWSDEKQGKNRGLFSAETFVKNRDDIHTLILPTKVLINDSLWHVLPGEIHFMKESMDIKSFGVQHADQSLRLNGRLSDNPADSLFIHLNKIDVDYIMDLANISDFSFSGLATGKAAIANTLKNLQLHAFLDVPHFCFNNGLMGHAGISGSWNINDKRLHLFGDIQEEGVGYTQVKGYVDLKEKELDLHIHGKNTNLFCLNKYIGGIFDDFQGRATGYCRVYGPFKKIDFGGSETASVSATIGATGVRYNLSDGQVVMTPGKFAFKNFNMLDGEEGKGTFNGHLLHNHLKKIRYHVDVRSDYLKVYDKSETLDMPFYATAYGTGGIILNGKPGLLEADINMRPESKTVFVYTVDSPESFGDVQLLRFGNTADTMKNEKDMAERRIDQKVQSPSMDIRLNFLIDMNPEATLKVIMDRKTGDHLLVHGYGPIRASFYNKGAFEMFGKLNVQRGVYKMSIQDVIRKDFEFTNGSYINFSGDPFMGDLGLRAVYTVNSASLSDLNIGNNLSESSVRVNCVLNFSGKVKSPQVSFDLELPTVSDDVQQMVRNLISSEEDMNMQILYLLGVGRFYTYNYSSTEAGANQSQSAVAVKSFLSNTLSSQLNNIISNAVGSSNWSFGANLSTGSVGWSDMEVEGILSGRLLNNRLLINGNFGYRDRPAYSTTTNFVGDFDVRYLLTPGGGVSLKAYSETNDRYFSKSSLTTQGVGLLLRRDFTNIKDLFKIRKREKGNKIKKSKEKEPVKVKETSSVKE